MKYILEMLHCGGVASEKKGRWKGGGGGVLRRESVMTAEQPKLPCG